jgi:hypothetical protein
MNRPPARPSKTIAATAGANVFSVENQQARDAPLTAEELLRRYCTMVYARTGSYEETARRLQIDRRTARARVDTTLLEQLKAGPPDGQKPALSGPVTAAAAGLEKPGTFRPSRRIYPAGTPKRRHAPMFEMIFLSGFLLFVLPLALLGGMAYLFFWLITAVLKTAGAVVGTVMALVFCVFALVGIALFGISCLPFLMLH